MIWDWGAESWTPVPIGLKCSKVGDGIWVKARALYGLHGWFSSGSKHLLSVGLVAADTASSPAKSH